VTIDYNHPLAGEELKFKVKVIDVKPFDDRTKVLTQADLDAAKAKK
jgi:FKBP-type peptidyl-prolyl cis-trans isomerase 2